MVDVLTTRLLHAQGELSQGTIQGTPFLQDNYIFRFWTSTVSLNYTHVDSDSDGKSDFTDF